MQCIHERTMLYHVVIFSGLGDRLQSLEKERHPPTLVLQVACQDQVAPAYSGTERSRREAKNSRGSQEGGGEAAAGSRREGVQGSC